MICATCNKPIGLIHWCRPREEGPRFITIGEVEKVARALCRHRIELNNEQEEKARDEAQLQRAEDASWMYFTDAAKVALKGMGYVEA
jgi:hypothetical protein